MKALLNDVSVSSILIALAGLVLLLMPSLTNTIIVIGIGTVLVIYGAGRIFRYIRRDATSAMVDHDLAIGLICVVSGIFMYLYSPVVIGILPFLFGLFVIFGGARSIQTAFDFRRFHGTHWNWHLYIGIVFVIVGIIAIRDPFATAALLTRFIGAALLVMGIYMFAANRKVSRLREKYMAGPDIIDQDSVR